MFTNFGFYGFVFPAEPNVVDSFKFRIKYGNVTNGKLKSLVLVNSKKLT